MYHRNYNRNEEKKDEKPPYSRIFVVCSRELGKDDLQPKFEQYGDIENIYLPKDRSTGESKGVAYIQYSKTSSAAAAIKELHMKTIGDCAKPIKVMIATNRNDKTDVKDENFNRLFIKISKQATESEIKEHFSRFANVDSVYIQKDRVTNESKGLAYVQFYSFLDAAKAFEECDKKYKPMFATPKQELKRARDNMDFNDSFNSSRSHSFIDYYPPRDDVPKRPTEMPLPMHQLAANTSISVTCSPALPQKYIERLFNVIPGVIQFKYSMNSYLSCNAVVTYSDDKAAAHALERLNHFEFPSGELITIKRNDPLSTAANELSNIVNNFKSAVDSGNPDLMQLADAIAKASTLIKAATSGTSDVKEDLNYCNVHLPPPQPALNIKTPVAQRCFIVCKPNPPPGHVLKDVFCRFGDLIDVSTFPNKTFGFVKYASKKSAQEAIKTLHGATVCGVILKVLEADEKPSKDDKMNTDIDMVELDINTDRKRIKLDDQSD